MDNKVPSSDSSVTSINSKDNKSEASPSSDINQLNNHDHSNGSSSLVLQKSSTTSSSVQNHESFNTTNNNKMLNNNSNNNSLDSVLSDADQEALESRTPSSSASSSSNHVPPNLSNSSSVGQQNTSDTGQQQETSCHDSLNEPLVLSNEDESSLIPTSTSLPNPNDPSQGALLNDDHNNVVNEGLPPNTPSGPPTSTPVGHSPLAPSGAMSTPGTPSLPALSSVPPSVSGQQQLPLSHHHQQQSMIGQQPHPLQQRMPLPPSGQSPQHQSMSFAPQQQPMGSHPGSFHPNIPPQQQSMMSGIQIPPGINNPGMQQPPQEGPPMGMNMPMTGPPQGPPPPGSKGGIHSSDSHYAQQQSHIFVYSTEMANSAAEAVLQQRCPSIISWHCEREETKQFLQKNPLKTEQFNRQNNHTAFMNSMATKKGGPMRMHVPPGMQGHPMGPQFGPGVNRPPFGPNGPMSGQWNHPPGDPRVRGNWPGPLPPGQGFPPNQGQFPGNRFPPHLQGNNSAMHMSPNGSPNFPPNSPMMQQQQPFMGNMPPGMIKMEEENLTPQQKQHREEKLATLRQLTQTLQPVMGEQVQQQQQQQQQPPFGPRTDGQIGDQMMNQGCDANMMHNHHQHNHHNPHGMNPSPGGPDWIKMEHPPPIPSIDGQQNPQIPTPPATTSRKRGRQTPSVNSPSANLIANSPRGHPPPNHPSLPPPPYQGGHRGSTGSITSPLPASPAGNMGGNCPLPSPRMQSPADSSRQQQRPNPYPSPGTPSGSDFMSLNSPKPHMNGPRSGRKSIPSEMKGAANEVMTEINLNSNKSPLGDRSKLEAQLMPVPSPQQIQYSLNAFEGQELTIQKQPNTSLRDSELISPPDINASFESNNDPFHQNMSGGPHFMENGMPFNNNPHNMDSRFGQMNNCPPGGPHFNPNEMHSNPRFMNPDSMQRMPFDGPRGAHPGMNGPSFGPGMDNHPHNMRFPNNCGPGGPGGPPFMHSHGPHGHPRMRGPPPGDMNRFPNQFHPNSGPNMNDANLPPSSVNNNMMSGPPGDKPFNPSSGETVSSTHLANLQKMAPPFDIGSLPGKNDSPSPMNPMLPGPGMHGGRTGQFDPISSMASMADSPGPQGMMGPPGSGMSVASSSSNTTVNFSTQMSSMQNMNQGQVNNCPPGQSPGMGFGPPSNAAMMGGPQTVNNTYVNANLSIQQLNIQGFDPNMNNSPGGQGMPMHPNQMHGNNMGMNERMSPKMGRQMPPSNNFSGPRGPNNGQNFNSGMNQGPPPIPTSGPGSRGPRGSGNKPNTIQYHPRGPQMNQPQQKPPLNMDFLSYDNKGPPPGHNMPFYPEKGNPALAGPRGPGMNQGGRPPIMRGHSPMQRPPSQMNPQQMGNFPHDFNRGNFNQGPNNGPPNNNNMMMGGPPPNNFMPQGNMYGGPNHPPPTSMSPGMGIDSCQPLPPSFNNFGHKQGPPHQQGPQAGNFPNQSSNPNDPLYTAQFQSFQQQLYATSPRGAQGPQQQPQGIPGGQGMTVGQPPSHHHHHHHPSAQQFY